jgi:hypothetical protein
VSGPLAEPFQEDDHLFENGSGVMGYLKSALGAKKDMSNHPFLKRKELIKELQKQVKHFQVVFKNYEVVYIESILKLKNKVFKMYL